MIIEKIVSKTFGENSWIVGNGETTEAVIIDPGASFEKIKNKLEELELSPQLILNTHLHPDHLISGRDLQDHYEIPYRACEYEKSLFNIFDQVAQGLGFPNLKQPKITEWLEDNATIELANLQIKVIHTPGHSPGSCCFLFNDLHLFSGDTLFSDSIGRTDLPYGSAEQIRKSLKRLADLPIRTKIYPGHGVSSSLEKELNNNPYLI